MRLPRVDRVAARPELDEARARLGPRGVVSIVRQIVQEERDRLLAGGVGAPTEDAIVDRVRAAAARVLGGRARRVINATGVVVHTNLGRAPLGPRAVRAVSEAAAGYASLEVDLATGRRGGRGAFLEHALQVLTGAEDALAVNNCAGAILLALAATARGRPVVVSRGELVEIGGGFRVPEIMAESGAVLVEIGTTNKTRLADYERALDAHPGAAVLRVHPSNFVQLGFVERPELEALGRLARERGVALIEDLGGGALVDFRGAGIVGEPTVADSIAAGVSVVTFSGDKALGGAQAGIAAGTADIVKRMRKHPLARALRLGRLPQAALEATLASYLEGQASEEVPALVLTHTSAEGVRARAERWAVSLAERGVAATAVWTEAEMGGGALPGQRLRSAAVRLEPAVRAEELAARLRGAVPAVLGRIVDGAVLLDARTVLEGEDDLMLDAVASILAPRR